MPQALVIKHHPTADWVLLLNSIYKQKKSIKVAVDWQKKTGIYTWVGAWMPGDFNKGDNYSVKERIEFASFMTRQLDKYGIPFAINSDDKFYDYQAENWIPQYKDLLKSIFM